MNKKSLAQVIAVALLLVTTVLSAVFFQTWFQTFQSGLLIDVESQSYGNNFRLGIKELIGEKLFINSGNELNISQIKIDKNYCNFTGVISGFSGINVSDCINNLTTNTPNIVLVTNNGVISEKVFVRDGFVGGEETGSSFTPTSCYNPINVGTIGVEFPCTDMLIVNRSMLDFAIANNPINGGEDFYLVHNGTNYTFGDSTYNIFTGQVTDMSILFSSRSTFNSDINYWDVSNVSKMWRMFNGASTFNHPLNNWDTSNVDNMWRMFDGASSFNQDLSNWNLSFVINTAGMFWNANNFNSDLSSWNVKNVYNMNSMFRGASSFSSDLSNWNISGVINTGFMFFGAISFNSDLSSWNVSNVSMMGGMFRGASSFNSDLSSWDVNKVTNMDELFRGASSFNSDLSSWDVSNVTSMRIMFRDASSFDSNLSLWNVSAVENMDIMFLNAISFNQDLSSWCVPLISSESFNFDTNTPAWDPKIGRQPQWNTSC